MSLTYEHQMQILKDILSNHQTDCCGSVSECEQVERLVKSLMANTAISDNIRPVLQQIYDYSHNGISAPNLNDHINGYQENLSQWVNDMNSYS
ncbi:YtzH-like family protein [Falsibacillus pallidus]|uniref:YtzH-like protein n=1 Tax=Falsibacillus pallidus TaxID=493781 RepID=A0A370GPC3_9BACI|nr:YtzH-like family protein [Falsibacillus pallidus]RDI44324.1 YtzH-like protein [Falsibacillus pallidus]